MTWRREKQGQALLLQGKLEKGLDRWVPTCRDRAGAAREEVLHTRDPQKQTVRPRAPFRAWQVVCSQFTD